MAETSAQQPGRARNLLLLVVFLGGWIAAIVAFALFMRGWVPEVDLEASLAAIEEAETEPAEPGGPASPGLQPLSGPLPALAVSGSIYVPVYSSLYVGGERRLKSLSATMSLRNTSADQALVVTGVTTFDAGGRAVADRFDGPQVLAPMATAEFYIDQSSASGNPVAAVLITWGAEAPILRPLGEAVIIGSYGAKSLSLISRGAHRP